MENKNTLIVKSGCYAANISMAVVANVPPVLFLTFRSLYGLSYSLLGLLVVINFFTQLGIDLIFSFFAHKFNIAKTVKIMPLICISGFLAYAILPTFIPNNVFLALVVGTVIFSAASGLAEVLISPTIAALPSDNPDREMSKLHSSYAWGAVAVITISTIFLSLFGVKNWQWLILLFCLLPFCSFLLFSKATLPKMDTPEKVSSALSFFKNKTVLLCIFAIFLGGSAECTMAQWSSSYLERALGLPKILGDTLGVALFAVTLGIGRTLYSKIGKNISKVLIWGAVGSTLCYLITAITDIAFLGLFACAFTGFCASMLWPGSLIVASNKFSDGGVFIFAVMAVGGDLGASVGPQLVGIIIDAVIDKGEILANTLGYTTEQLGMKTGILFAMLFPLIAIFVYKKLSKNK